MPDIAPKSQTTTTETTSSAPRVQLTDREKWTIQQDAIRARSTFRRF